MKVNVKKTWDNVPQRVKIFLLKKTKITATASPICIEHHCKARNIDLGFRSAR